MGSEKFEPFDVLNMGNILEFYLGHSDLHISNFFLFTSRSKKILQFIGLMVLKTNKQFGKICIGSGKIGKR